MIFNKINIRKIDSIRLLNTIVDKTFRPPSNKEKKEIQKEIIISVKKKDFRKSLNLILISLYFDYEVSFKNIRRKGLFRYSNYINETNIISGLVDKLLELNQYYDFIKDREVKYLLSVKNLSNLQYYYRNLHLAIIKEISLFNKNFKEKSLIKTLLAFVESLFLLNYKPNTKVNPNNPTNRSKEEISSAISYLIYFITDKYEQKRKDIGLVASEYILNGGVSKIIVYSCYVMDYKEIEILIADFNYTCLYNGDKLKVMPPSIDFDKSISLGYIRYELQSWNDHIGLLDNINYNEILSLEEVVDDLLKTNGDLVLFEKVKTHDIERYRLEISEPLINALSQNFFSKDHLFQEEAIRLSKIFKEQFLDVDALKNINIKKDLNLMDLLKLNRVFDLLYLLFSKQILKKENNKLTNTLLESLIPVFDENDINKITGGLVNSESIESYLDILYWEEGLDTVYDIQYHPFLFIQDYFLISLSIMYLSNSVRNLFASEYKKDNTNLLTDGEIDPLIEKLQNSFDKSKVSSFSNIQLNFGEIDFLSVFNNSIFIFECKQSLHPTSIYDLRTTYDYIKKAEKQLDRIYELHSKGKLIDMLEKSCNIKLNRNTKVIFAIVTSNRLFNGNAFKYPIRYINEISNFIINGNIRTNNGEFLLWKNDEISDGDLIEYLSNISRVEKLNYDSLSSTEIEYNLMEPSIYRDIYYLSSDIALPKLERFTKKLKKIK